MSRSLARVERLVKEPGITSVAANGLDRELPLVGDGQREELVRLGEGLGDQLWVDTVVDDIEEAHVAARRANLCSDPRQRGAFAFARGSEIDDGQCVFHDPPLSIRPAPPVGRCRLTHAWDTTKARSNSKQNRVKPNKTKQNSLVLFGFIRPNLGFPTSYSESK
jgi:hypothetical protein